MMDLSAGRLISECHHETCEPHERGRGSAVEANSDETKALLQKRNLQLLEHGDGNHRLPAFPGLIVKDSYWRWPERNLAGNAIDFHTQVRGLSFQQAMHDITSTPSR